MGGFDKLFERPDAVKVYFGASFSTMRHSLTPPLSPMMSIRSAFLTLAFFCLLTSPALADAVLTTKSSDTSSWNGKVMNSIVTVKVKGEWVRVDSASEGMSPFITLANWRTGENYVLSGEKVIKGGLPSASKTNPDRTEWEDTGKTDVVAGKNCRIHVRRVFVDQALFSEAKFWITSDLKALEPLLESLRTAPPVSTGTFIRDAPAGVVIKEESTQWPWVKLNKMKPASAPRPPEDLQKTVKRVVEFVSLEKAELPAADFEVKPVAASTK
ncbi:hypothetical protein AYO49_00360 [Verrucomicrobiaceae bacterium SCGC AG-212-N21]|nr:hypothetical protein AYO49_00360 [Verrucomicrobiaceae bacterium SCGC AG-212-N21]